MSTELPRSEAVFRPSNAWRDAGIDARYAKAVDPQYVGQGTQIENGSVMIYTAVDRVASEFIAVKNARGATETNSIKREFNLVKDLSHPNILTPLAFGRRVSKDGVVKGYMMMRLLPALLRAGTDAQLRGAFYGILMGLAALHENRIVHGDIAVRNTAISAAGVGTIFDYNCSARALPLTGYGLTPRGWSSFAVDFENALCTLEAYIDNSAVAPSPKLGREQAAQARADLKQFAASVTARAWRRNTPPSQIRLERELRPLGFPERLGTASDAI